MRVREVMTGEVVTAAPDATVREVAELMRERNVGSVVLVDDGGVPVGFITDRDLAVSVVADAREPGDRVAAHASSPVVTAEPEMDVSEAAELMVGHAIRRLPIVDAGRLVGILTLDDLTVRTGDVGLVRSMTTDITRASLPDFYFFRRGD
jgi:CBS domain-containing protein